MAPLRKASRLPCTSHPWTCLPHGMEGEVDELGHSSPLRKATRSTLLRGTHISALFFFIASTIALETFMGSCHLVMNTFPPSNMPVET